MLLIFLNQDLPETVLHQSVFPSLQQFTFKVPLEPAPNFQPQQFDVRVISFPNFFVHTEVN